MLPLCRAKQCFIISQYYRLCKPSLGGFQSLVNYACKVTDIFFSLERSGRQCLKQAPIPQLCVAALASLLCPRSLCHVFGFSHSSSLSLLEVCDYHDISTRCPLFVAVSTPGTFWLHRFLCLSHALPLSSFCSRLRLLPRSLSSTVKTCLHASLLNSKAVVSLMCTSSPASCSPSHINCMSFVLPSSPIPPSFHFCS